MELKEATQLINSYDFNEIAEFQYGVMQEAIDTVFAELDRLQIENKEKEEIIKDMQDELKHIPSIVSETM